MVPIHNSQYISYKSVITGTGGEANIAHIGLRTFFFISKDKYPQEQN